MAEEGSRGGEVAVRTAPGAPQTSGAVYTTPAVVSSLPAACRVARKQRRHTRRHASNATIVCLPRQSQVVVIRACCRRRTPPSPPAASTACQVRFHPITA